MTVSKNLVEQEPETLQVRIHGEPSLPTLIYLPGLHGDWTLIGNFRRALAGRVRFVEVTYPRTLSWSLAEYGDGVKSALLENNIREGWIVAESFGSQVAWPLRRQNEFKVHAIILAGGFVRHPMLLGGRLAE